MNIIFNVEKEVVSFMTSSAVVSSFPPLTFSVILSFMKVFVVMGGIMVFWLVRCKEDWKSLLLNYIGAILIAVGITGGYLW